MKKSFILLLPVICFFFSCKNDPQNQDIRFVPSLSSAEDSISYDSVDYTVVNYSDLDDLKNSSDMNNPDIYSHSIRIDVLHDYINLVVGQTYVIKKFDMISKEGNILYYMPYGENLGLPYSLKIHEEVFMILVNVYRYPR
jgi:hypothetical protein